MAADPNAYQRVDIIHALEDIQDLIYDTSPTDCPFIQNAPATTADNSTIEWVEDVLDAADVSNAFIDGDTFDAAAITQPSRLTNECQISRKDFRITRRARKINKAGPNDEVARQVARKGLELKRDMESIVLNNQAKVVDNGTAAPLVAGLPTWIADAQGAGRADRGATGTDPAGDGTTAAGDGTIRALSEAGLLGVVRGIYDGSQAMPEALMLGTASKQLFSNYMFDDTSGRRVATQYQDQGRSPRGGVRVVGAVDVWVTDFAIVDVVPNRFQRDRDAFFVNFDYVEVSYFDPISTDAMGKDADDEPRMVLADYSIRARNRPSLGVFADIDTGTAMVP